MMARREDHPQEEGLKGGAEGLAETENRASAVTVTL